MSQKVPLLTLSVVAAALVAADRFITGAGVYPAAGAGARGVAATDAAAIGDLVPVDVLGTSVVTAGAAIAKDAKVQIGTDGKVITLAAGVAVGVALEAAASDGDKIEIFLIPNA